MRLNLIRQVTSAVKAAELEKINRELAERDYSGPWSPRGEYQRMEKAVAVFSQLIHFPTRKRLPAGSVHGTA